MTFTIIVDGSSTSYTNSLPLTYIGNDNSIANYVTMSLTPLITHVGTYSIEIKAALTETFAID